jgi:hypothetical protein
VRVVFEGDYPDEFALELFAEAGIALERFMDGTLIPVDLNPYRPKHADRERLPTPQP